MDIEDALNIGAEVDRWIERMCEMKSEDGGTERLMKATKPVLVNMLSQTWDCMKQQQTVFQELLTEVLALRSGIIAAQQSVIKIQGELLAAKDDQLQSVRTAVKDTVQEAVQTEIKSYSQAVAKAPRAALSTATLKKAVKEAVDETDRSRNLMVFGLSEDDGEQLVKKVDEVFQQLGERPRIEATRVGVQDSGKTRPRPVKVTVSNPAMVLQILRKARNLRHDAKHKDIYICPDRTAEQRAEQRKLVISRKKKATEEPNKRHFIRGGKVCSEQISAT